MANENDVDFVPESPQRGSEDEVGHGGNLIKYSKTFLNRFILKRGTTAFISVYYLV